MKMGLYLLDEEELQCKLAIQLFKRVKTPKTTVHTSSITFSSIRFTLLLDGEL